MKAKIVIGSQFGDEGKGRVVDFLCIGSSNPCVVRFSGGQQVGHTVILNGIKHVHSNFGSGTLRGVPSYYTEHCCAYLNSMRVELEVLRGKGIEPEIVFHPFVKMTTPYDQAFNRMSEKENLHGSCGLGIGSTMKRHLETGYKLYAMDFKNSSIVKVKLLRIKEFYFNQIVENDWSLAEFENSYLDNEEYFLKHIEEPPFRVADYNYLNQYDNLIFEGSQGILLDMDHGIFPNVTYARTTSRNALEICKRLGVIPSIWYVTRCYQTRHGNGWMSETGEIKLINTVEEINVTNQWQGEFRIQEIDYDLLNYSLLIDQQYILDSAGVEIEKNLVVTCCDQRPGFQFDYGKLDFQFVRRLETYGPSNDMNADFFSTWKTIKG